MFQKIFEYMEIIKGISMSDIVGWTLTFLAGGIVYKLIDHVQTSMERHSVLKDIENTFSNIYNSDIAKSGDFLSNINQKGQTFDEWMRRKINGANDDRNRESENVVCANATEESEVVSSEKLENVVVRAVLHDHTPWDVYVKEDCDIENPKLTNAIEIFDQQRYIQIRNHKKPEMCADSDRKYYNEWISTQGLHEILLHCRRIEKMFKDGVVKRIDLADMFREIVPLGVSGRIEFFRTYFGKYDADCLGYLVMQTIVSCEKYHNQAIVNFFVNYYWEHEYIERYFVKNSRIRPIKDFRAVRKFKKICNRYKKSKV